MRFRTLLLTFAGCWIYIGQIQAQVTDTVFNLSAIVYDATFHPVRASHVININTYQGDVTDSLGIFRLKVQYTDTILIRNIAFQDTLVTVFRITEKGHVVLTRKRYELEEAKVFTWGSTYDHFKDAVIEMPIQQTLGESMGLPRQDPDYVPLEMDEQAVKSAGLLLASPITYFYQNFNKQAKSARKVYWLKKNQSKNNHFNELLSGENLSTITGLEGEAVLKFQSFLVYRMVCDFKCNDLDILSEIHGLWKVYQELEERGML